MRRIVLAPEMSRDAFAGYCYAQDWHLEAIMDEDRGIGRPSQDVCRDDRTGTRIAFVDDYLVDVRYLYVDGPGEAQLEAQLYKAKEVATIPPAAIFKMLRRGAPRGERLLGIRYLAVTAPASPDQRWAKAFRALLADRDPDVRDAALQCASYPAWPELRRTAEKMTKHDPHPGVRETAAALVRSFKKVAKAGGARAGGRAARRARGRRR